MTPLGAARLQSPKTDARAARHGSDLFARLARDLRVPERGDERRAPDDVARKRRREPDSERAPGRAARYNDVQDIDRPGDDVREPAERDQIRHHDDDEEARRL